MRKKRRSLRKLIQNLVSDKRPIPQNKQYLKILDGHSVEYIFSNRKNIYNNQVARTAIDAIATHFAKMVPKHIKGTRHVTADVNYLLNHPNKIMSRYDFLYKVISNLYTHNNTFIYIDADSKTRKIKGFYPVNASSYEILKDEKGEVYINFTFLNESKYILPYEQLVVLRRFYNENDFNGSSNEVIGEAIETQETTEQGLKHAIKLSNSLKGVVKFEENMFSNEHLEKYKNQFMEDFLDDSTGIAAIDSRADFKEINIKPLTLSESQQKQVNNAIYNYFRVNEKIINSSYTEEEWNSFYQSVIEPLAIQLSLELTKKIFGKKAIKEGNKIILTTDILNYSSIETKIKLTKELSWLGVITKDEIRDLFNLLPLENKDEGNKLLQSLNFVDSDIANLYQLSKEKVKKEEEDENQKES